MRITMLTVGTRGDVQPVVALGVECAERGHDVTVATHAPFRNFVESRGLSFAPLPGDPRTVLDTPEAQRLVRTGTSVVTFLRRFLRLLRPWFDELTEAAESACERADLILYSPLAFVGWHLGEASGVPTALMALQPLEPTSEWSTVSLGGRNLGGPINLLTHAATRQLAWQPLRRPVQRWRRRLGLAPDPFTGPYRRLREERHPQLYGFSEAVVPRPADWPDHVSITGYWFLGTPEAWTPPPDLTGFLDAGPAPIYVGFGSMSGTEAATESVVRSALALGRRVIVDGPAEVAGDLAGEVFAVHDVPHSWLLPACAGAVHHGGAGTTAAALRAGLPSVVVPGYADQPFWGRRVHAIGAGPEPLDPDHLHTDAVTAAVRSLDRFRPGAKAVAAALAIENGTATAADLVEELARSGP